MPVIAFLGEFGDFLSVCLAQALLEGYHAVALSPKPPELKAQMLGVRGLTPNILETQLRTVQGEATDVESVSKALIINVNPDNGSCMLVSHIISDIGAATPPEITELATHVMINVLDYIATFYFKSFHKYREVAPRLTTISWLGITASHKGKTEMEEILGEQMQKVERNVLCGGLLIVKPSLLMKDYDTPVCGVAKGVAAGKDTCLQEMQFSQGKPAQTNHTARLELAGRWIIKEMANDGDFKWNGKKIAAPAEAFVHI